MIVFALLASISSLATEPEITYTTFFTVGLNGKKIGTFSIGVFGNYDKKVSRNFQSLVNCTKRGLCYQNSEINVEENGRRITFGRQYIENSTYLLPYLPKRRYIKHLKPFYVSAVNAYGEYIGSKIAIDFERRADKDNIDFVFGKVTMGERLLKQMQFKPNKKYYIVKARVMPNDTDVYDIL